MNAVAVIPARWGSSRLPGKPLLDLEGYPVIQWTWSRVRRVPGIDRVIVATDDARILEAVTAFGGEALLTPSDCPNGTLRVYEATKNLPCQWILNVQGDEPLIEPDHVALLLERLKRGDAPMATVVTPARAGEMEDPNAVKVALTRDDRALYFSRSPLPYPRHEPKQVWRHLGLYGYTKEFLALYAGLAPTPCSEAESLEQLRVLEWGYPIAVAKVEQALEAPGIDVAADLERARRLVQERGLSL